MAQLADWFSYMLSAMGLTVLIVWPQSGPGAYLRERALRRALPARAAGVLDCYICCGFWCGLLLSPIWFAVDRQLWCWSGCLTTPALFWLVLRPWDGSNGME